MGTRSQKTEKKHETETVSVPNEEPVKSSQKEIIRERKKTLNYKLKSTN